MSQYATRLENATDTAPRMRAADALGLTPNGAVRARGGLRPDNGGVVTVSAGTMNVNVAPLSAWVDAPLSGQVGFPFVSDASVALAIDPGHASLVRIDVVAVVVREDAFDAGGSTGAALEVIKGTPGAGVPALPNAAVPLRNISVHAGASVGSGGLSAANLSTDRRQWTVAAGGILPVASSTERDALPAATVKVVQRLDTGKIEVWDGSAWVVLQVEQEDIGPVALTGTASPAYIVKNGWVTVRCAGSVSIPNNSSVTLVSAGGIPAAYRPDTVIRGHAFCGADTVGTLTVGSDGSLTVHQNGGVTEGTVSGSVVYPLP